MLNAARAHGMPTMVIAMMTAAISQPAAIHRPPKAIHSTLSSSANSDIANSLRRDDALSSALGEDGDCSEGSPGAAHVPAKPGRGPGPRLGRLAGDDVRERAGS